VAGAGTPEAAASRPGSGIALADSPALLAPAGRPAVAARPPAPALPPVGRYRVGPVNGDARATAVREEAIAAAIARAADGVEEIDIHPVASEVAVEAAPVREPMSRPAPPPAPAPIANDPLWRVADRSAAGWRLVAPEGSGNGLALGALVAVRPAAAGDWMLGVVRRIRKRTDDAFEAGMALITERAVAVTLRARRPVDEDMDFEVDGADAVSMGARFGGLYLMPPSPADAGRALRTLIIPTSEHFEGRSLFLSTSRSNYAVTLRHVVDQQAEWSWVAIRVNGRAPRLSA